MSWAKTHPQTGALNSSSPSAPVLTEQPLRTCPHSKGLNYAMNDKPSGIHTKVGWGKKKKIPSGVLAQVYQPLQDQITFWKRALPPLLSSQVWILFQRDVLSQRVHLHCCMVQNIPLTAHQVKKASGTTTGKRLPFLHSHTPCSMRHPDRSPVFTKAVVHLTEASAREKKAITKNI